jgi:accessory gene regulator protein AgrB
MEKPKKKLICIGVMILCLSWIVGVISDSISVGIMFASFCVAYLIYQSLNKEEDE